MTQGPGSNSVFPILRPVLEPNSRDSEEVRRELTESLFSPAVMARVQDEGRWLNEGGFHNLGG
jgi:hypothetical protein